MKKYLCIIGYVIIIGVLIAIGCSKEFSPLQKQSLLATTFYVSLAGSDIGGDGSSANPWRTIEHAANTIPVAGGVTILVRSGTYNGATSIERAYLSEVIIKSEQPYGAMLTNVSSSTPILTVKLEPPGDGPIRLSIEEFVFSNDGSTMGPCTSRAGYMIFISNVSNFTFKNNIVYSNDRQPHCNNMIKVGIVGATQAWHDVVFEGNIIGNPPMVNGGNDALVIFEPTEFDIRDNIFYSARGGNAGGSLVALRRRWGPELRSPRYMIQRNIFINWESSPTASFLRIGGWGTEIHDALVENNLFVGNSTVPIGSPIILEDASQINMRANTIVGDFPSTAFAFRLGTDAGLPAPTDIDVHNNIFSDPTGTMNPLVVIHGAGDINETNFDSNVYWNDGNAIPPHFDGNAIEENPLIPAQNFIVLPEWDNNIKRFISGSQTIREEFERLARTFGTISFDSPARDAATVNMPSNDILGDQRNGLKDIGCFESNSQTGVPR